MVRADVSSTNHERLRGVADSLQRSEDPVCAASSEISAVLKSEPTRLAFSDNSDGFEEQSGLLAIDAETFCVGAGDVLAGRASDNDAGQTAEVSPESFSGKGANIVIDQHVRVVLRVERAPPFDILACGDRLVSCTMHAERPAAGGRAEQVEDFRDHARTAARRCAAQ